MKAPNIIKKDGTIEPWNFKKIESAVTKASARANYTLQKDDFIDLREQIKSYMVDFGHWFEDVPSSLMHQIVIHALNMCKHEPVARAYQEWRDYKTSYAKEFEKLKTQSDGALYLGDKENANFDSALISTKGSLIRGYLTKALYQKFYMSKKERELTKRGDIYIHDMRDMPMHSINCGLFDMATVLKNGFEMSNIKYSEPNSVLSALQVAGDVTLCASSQQFGGFTLPELDKTLVPYCKKTWDRAISEARYYRVFSETEYAMQVLTRELVQGFQSLELKLNTIPSSRGDFAFTTITFGHIPLDMPEEERGFMQMIDNAILSTREYGHNGTSVVFPKLVFLYDKETIDKDEQSKQVFEHAVECSAKCMYPDFLSLSSDQGSVSRIFQEDGCITSPMGCRAYLSQWKDPETGKNVAVGRCNIGAVSLNLPLIYTIAKHEHRDFYTMLHERLNDIREFLKKRYQFIAETKASTNPLAFTQGGFYKGFRKPDECIGDLTEYMTASFGITALNELTLLATGKTIYEDNSRFAWEVVAFIKEAVRRFKEEDGYLYALYGTPAESLCGTQAKQYADYCEANGIKNILNIEYFTNSFHMHVSEDITPFEKQNAEEELFHMIEGGHIQYVRVTNPENTKALKSFIERGMEKGFYQGVNFDACTCEDCGSTFSNPTDMVCPNCGSHNITVISRTCGYLGYSRIHGDSRMNDAKMAEIKDRVSM